MQNMLRRTISFTSRQFSFLKNKATELEISVAELMRRIIDKYIENDKK